MLGVTVHALGGAATSGLASMALGLRAVSAVMAEHRRSPFDIVHGLWAHEAGFVATLAAARLGIPSVVSLLGGELVGLPGINYGAQLNVTGRALVRFSLWRASIIAAGSEYLRTLALRRLGEESGSRIRVLPLGVDPDLFHPDPGPNHSMELAGHPRLLQVGSLVPVKNQAISIETVRKLIRSYPNLRLHLVGDGPLRQELQDCAARSGLKSAVVFHGAVPHHRLPAYYRSADLCLLPSLHEGLGLVTLEAAACATGTVGSAVGVLPELGPAASAVPAGDAAGLAEAVSELLGESQRCKQMGLLARSEVVRRYSLECTTQAFIRVYRGLASAG